jgi:transposase
MRVFVGDDWAKDHHDLYVMDQQGNKLAGKQVPEGPVGMTEVHALLAPFIEEPGEALIGIETERGMWVQALIAAGYEVYVLNPLASARYRVRHSVGGAKSDTGDAKVLADAMRTDAHNHRPVAADSAGVDALKVVARAHQSLVWERTRHSNRLGHSLSEYFPAAVQAFPALGHSDALSVLAKTPVPAEAARLSVSQIRAALRRGGRRRYLDSRAQEIQKALRSPQLVRPARG